MVFYCFGPDASSWAFGNDKFSFANNLTGSIAIVWNQLGAHLSDKQQSGTQIEWMSTCGDKYAIMTKKGDLLSNCNDMLNHVKQQLRDQPGTSVYHVSFSPQGGWFVSYDGGTAQISGYWPLAFYTLVGNQVSTSTGTRRQATQVQSIFVGHNDAMIIKMTRTMLWKNVSPNLQKLLESFKTYSLSWPLPGPNTVLCPWSAEWFFVQAVPNLMGQTVYPHSLPIDTNVNLFTYQRLVFNGDIPNILKPKVNLVAPSSAAASRLAALVKDTPPSIPPEKAPVTPAPQQSSGLFASIFKAYADAAATAVNTSLAAPAPVTSNFALLSSQGHTPLSTSPSPLAFHHQENIQPEGAHSEIDKVSKKFMDSTLKDSISSAILSEKPNVQWDDVAGLETAKTELQEAIIFPIRFPQMFKGKRQARRTLLLYGPPGTGKSYLAKAVATEVDHTLFSVSSGDIMSKWTGESQGLMRQLFVLAREKKPSIIFIDEIDALCGKRDGGGANAEETARLKTEFLVQMDGLGNNNEGVFVLAATNLPWTLDPAVRRRFQKRIHVPLPDDEARQELFKIHLGDMASSLKNTEVEFPTLSKKTEGFSGSDIANLVQDALMMPIRKVHTATHFRKFRDGSGEWYTPCRSSDAGAMAMKWNKVPAKQLKEPALMIGDLYEAVETTKASVGQEEIDKCAEWTTQFGLEGA